jgi:hypothetical protein
MKLDDILKSVYSDQKHLLTPFVVSLPMVYTIMAVYLDGYMDFPLSERIVFAVAATVAGLALYGLAAAPLMNDIYTGVILFPWALGISLVCNAAGYYWGYSFGIPTFISIVIFPAPTACILFVIRNKSSNKRNSVQEEESSDENR